MRSLTLRPKAGFKGKEEEAWFAEVIAEQRRRRRCIIARVGDIIDRERGFQSVSETASDADIGDGVERLGKIDRAVCYAVRNTEE